jgi:hypothetical protein
MGWIPKIKLGSSYVTAKQLPHVQSISDIEPGIKRVQIEGVRGAGELIIPGSRPAYNIVIRGILLGSDTTLPDGTAYAAPTGTKYEHIAEQIDWLRDNIGTEESYLYVDKTSADYDTYIVRRIDEIQFSDSLRNSVQEYAIAFRVV